VIHDELGHYLLAPQDIAGHLLALHGLGLTQFPFNDQWVLAYLQEQGIPLDEKWETSVAHAWHEWLHNVDEAKGALRAVAQRLMRPGVDIPIEPDDRIAFGSVQTVTFRDEVNGVRLTAHHDPVDNCRWVVQHVGQTGDFDGTPVWRSVLVYSAELLNEMWDRARGKL